MFQRDEEDIPMDQGNTGADYGVSMENNNMTNKDMKSNVMLVESIPIERFIAHRGEFEIGYVTPR